MALVYVAYGLATTLSPLGGVETIANFADIDDSQGSIGLTQNADGTISVTEAAYLDVLMHCDYNVDSDTARREIRVYHRLAPPPGPGPATGTGIGAADGSGRRTFTADPTDVVICAASQGTASADGFDNAHSGPEHFAVGDRIIPVIMGAADPKVREYQDLLSFLKVTQLAVG